MCCPACFLSYIHCWGLGVACVGGSFVQAGSKVLEAERRYDAEEAGPLMASVLIEAAPPTKLLTPYLLTPGVPRAQLPSKALHLCS